VLPDLGEGAISVPVGDSPAFSRALADILDDAAAAATMGRAGRAVATERYDIERTAASLLDIYAALAGRASQGSNSRRARHRDGIRA
jgi:glycosyltransferase involved in cell wall biosynthesis